MALNKKELELKREIVGKINRHFGKTLDEATPNMIYKACAMTARDKIMEKWTYSHKTVKEKHLKKLYYMSFEFLMGRSLVTNIINLLSTPTYTNVLKDLGYELNDIKELEKDPGLGNGGLGRLAACFLDSLTTLDLPAYGCSIRYEYGLFKQQIVDGYQVETPDSWLEDGNVWEVARPEETVEVKFGGKVYTDWNEGRFSFRYENSHTVLAIPYDVPVCGYNSKAINKLRLWSARSPKHLDMSLFNHGNYVRAVEEKELAEVISKVLYPEDNHAEGKSLRLKQQYFMVSATMQWIIRDFKKAYGTDFSLLPEKVAIHINDTHPTLAIPELMRILMDDEGLGWDEAYYIVQNVFAYTNHTVMSEALEKWNVDMFKQLLPRIFMIVTELQNRLMARLDVAYPNDPKKLEYMAIISNNNVNMANLCLSVCHHINGVSKLHTQILTDDIFRDYYNLDNNKFVAITNGITFRRWIVSANPELTSLINSKIGDKWIVDSQELKNIQKFADDKEFRDEFIKIKYNNKKKLAKYIKEVNKIDVNLDSIFDVQAKRLHEYKRQLLCALYILYLYNHILENPNEDVTPRTFIFAAKSSPGYARAKLIIKLINSVAELVNNDQRIGNKLKVVFIANYSVSLAEKITIAADVSEQISTAGKEASGTGNMKFMLNGAVTVGTLDGANVEILEQVGPDNIYIFGLKAHEVKNKYEFSGQEVHDIYSSHPAIKKVLDMLIDGSIQKENPSLFKEIYQSLLFGDFGFADPYMVVRDFQSYIDIQQKVSDDYKNKTLWVKKAIANTANAGFFSSDRTISEYNKNIWKLEKIK